MYTSKHLAIVIDRIEKPAAKLFEKAGFFTNPLRGYQHFLRGDE